MESGKESSAHRIYLVPAVDKALGILALLKSERRDMSLAEIAKATGWHKSSVQRVLSTLCYHRFLRRDESGKKYSLGIALAEYGQAALNSLDIRQLADPFLQSLLEFSKETAVLAILNGSKVVMVDKKEPADEIRVSPFIGTGFPATATSNGKAMLAWLPGEQVDEILRLEGLPALTPNSITAPDAYRAELAAVRGRGYAIDREEFHEGVSGVSAPIFNAQRETVAAISLVGPSFRMTEEKIRMYGEKCVEAAARLSGRLH